MYGTKGTLLVPDPNTFGGPIRLFRPEDQVKLEAGDPALKGILADPYAGYKEVPLMFDYRENSRALGLSDMCKATKPDGRPGAITASSTMCWKSSLDLKRALERAGICP